MSEYCNDCFNSEVLGKSRCDTPVCPKVQAEERKKQIDKLATNIKAQRELYCNWCKEKGSEVCNAKKCKTAYVIAKLQEGIDELKK